MLRGWWTVAMVLVALDFAVAGAACAQAQEKADPATTQATPAAAGVPAQAAQATQASNKPKRLNPFTGDSAVTAEGKKLWFKYNCYGCHGTEAGGGMGSNLTDAIWAFGGDDASVFNTIKNGAGKMPPLGQMANIPDEEIWKLIAYVRSLYKGDPDAIVW